LPLGTGRSPPKIDIVATRIVALLKTPPVAAAESDRSTVNYMTARFAHRVIHTLKAIWK
jgi:hypothetical protein